MVSALRPWCCIALLSATACAGTPTGDDAGPGLELECTPPLSVTLSDSTDPRNSGVPTAAILWTDGRCEVHEDESHPDAVMVVADFTGIFTGSLSAAVGRPWSIVSSSAGDATSTEITRLPRDVAIDVELRSRDDAHLRVAVAFRVDGDVVMLLEMRLL